MLLHVKVTPKASFECIKKTMSADGAVLYKIYMTIAPPEDDKSNESVIKLLDKALDIAKSNLTITRGHPSREESIKIKTYKEKYNHE